MDGTAVSFDKWYVGLVSLDKSALALGGWNRLVLGRTGLDWLAFALFGWELGRFCPRELGHVPNGKTPRQPACQREWKKCKEENE